MECYDTAKDKCGITLIPPPVLLWSFLFFPLPFSPSFDGWGYVSCQRRERTWSAFLIEFEGFFLPLALNLGVAWMDWMQ